MKRFFMHRFLLWLLPVCILLVEFLPVVFNVYVRDTQTGLKMPLIIACHVVGILLLLLFLILLGFHFGKNVVIINTIVILLILYGFEFVLRKADPFLKLPFDSAYYAQHSGKYQGILTPPDPSVKYTWGHTMRGNKYGFRERDFQEPKPAGTYRVMVVGDSFTYGSGLAEEERYSNLLEQKLQKKFAGAAVKIEVLNFGIPGLSTVREPGVIEQYKDIVEPDLIIVGFCYNDPRPRREGRMEESRDYERKWKFYKRILQQRYNFLKLNYVGDLLVQLVDKIARSFSGVPDGMDIFKSVYDPASRDWKNFVAALGEIKRIAAERNLPTPIFALLDHFEPVRRVADLDNPRGDVKTFFGWFEQVRQAAEQVGLDVVNFEAEISARLRSGELTPGTLGVCRFDAHPSRYLNQIYADKIFARVYPIIEKKIMVE